MLQAAHTAHRPAASWPGRALCAALLLAGVMIVVRVIAPLSVATSATTMMPSSGVVMPDDSAYRRIATELLQRSTPVRLAELTISGAGGTVATRRAEPGHPGFLSTYLNPGVVDVLARATGASADSAIQIQGMRLHPDAAGRQIWQLTGRQDGHPWRATVRPNGTGLRRG